MGRRTFGQRIARVATQGVIVVGLVCGTAAPGYATTHKGHGGGGGSATPTGNDISYPQCGATFPTAPAFGISGLNGGLANNLNPCFGPSSSYPRYTQSELYWSVASSTGATSQPKASLYINTGDPGNVYNGTAIADWPTSSSSADPYGTCTTTTVALSNGSAVVGANSDACAWQYGDNMASQDARWLASAASAIDSQSPPVTVAGTAASYPWWLDVETANSWQSDTTMNVAALQGMVAGLHAAGASTVGAYSTSYQWGTITGGTTSSSGSLYGIPDWIPGAQSLSGAQSNCTLPSFTGGAVKVTQWFASPDDSDYAC